MVAGVYNTSGTEGGVYSNIAGSAIINFEIYGMPAYTYIYPYINKKSISNYTKQNGQNFGALIRTDAYGMATGTIILPSDYTLNFPAGVLEIQFGDSSVSFESSKSYATTQYIVSPDVKLVTLESTDVLLRSADSTIKDLSVDVADWQTKKAYVEPLAQVFYVDPAVYPNGVFATSVDLYFYDKDTTNKTVAIELRNVSGGVPSNSFVLAESYVVKSPQQVTIPYGGFTTLYTEEDLRALYTRFTFKKPIYLLPNSEYAICVLSDSGSYKLFSGTVGKEKYFSTNTVSSNQNVRRLFNTGDYANPDLDTDICFKINIASFATGSATFNIISKDTSITDYYNKYTFKPSEKVFTGVSSINYSIYTKKNGAFPGTPTSLAPEYLTILDSNRTANVVGDVKISTTFTNQNQYVSPILDLETTNFIVVNDLPLTTSTASTLPNESTYVSKLYSVEDGKEFSGLSVEVSVNKPTDTSIKVYCKVLAVGDNDLASKEWTELPRKKDVSLVNVTDKTTYVRDIYQKLTGLTYTTNTGITYNGKFNKFVIRIDFLSTNSAVSPSIRKMDIKTV